MNEKMKGKREFTESEICAIKELINQKLQSPTNEQKKIRQQIRNIGFYWEDFHPQAESPKIEYNIENFEKLINKEDGNGIIVK
ncbi:hypothetical protein [uncultured Bacteroides sp.]|uniref:hypothetical protein n=1 Tax=uncultured Bacteroides sp. TaxID=162156 RepID=UPI0026027BFE|nr:hypothetical protein [uncultured Bacteroides sp.]